MRKVTVTGGSLKGAFYGDLPEAEIAKSAKSYRGDARFMQYCRQFMASKLIDGAEEPENTGANIGPPENKWRLEYWSFCKGIFARCFTKWSRGKLLVLLGMMLLLISRPSFSVLCGKAAMLVIKTAIRRSVALVTMVLDTVLDEAIQQIDSALAPTQVTHGQASTDPFPMGPPITKQDYFMHVICLLLGTLFGRHYGNAPFLARNL